MTNELIVYYDNDKRVARLTYSGEARAWPPIRRVCQDASEQMELSGPSSLTLPWWAFLGCRKELSYQAKRHAINVRSDSTASAKLSQAEQVARQYESSIENPPVPIEKIVNSLRSNGFNRDLTAEQLRNVSQLSRLPSGATFSVPGAGKTTEALAFYCLKRKSNSRLIVVCPKNAFPAWEEQLEFCLPSEKPFVRLRGGNGAIQKALSEKPEKVLITYHQLQYVTELLSAYMEDNASFVFLDESHRMKRGFTGVIGNRILSFAELPTTKLIMSGTPMPNDVGDLVPQFRFLYPEVPADEKTVEGYIKPIYVRTTKSELKLPEIRPVIKKISLRPAQFELYELLRSETARQSKKNVTLRDRMRLRKAGQSALRMLQVVTNPALLARVQFEHPELLSEALSEGDSPKLEYACLRARQLAFGGKKSIIWSSFVDNVELVSNRLVDLGAEFIHGGVEAGDENEEGTREQKIKRFHEDDNCYVLVANPAACGEGISLHTVCHHAIYLDRNYNAAQFLQSQDRIHRLGLQPEDITYVEILVAPNTVDESVHRRLTLKMDNMARVLGDHSLNIEPEVVDLDADGFDIRDFKDFLGHVSRQDVT